MKTKGKEKKTAAAAGKEATKKAAGGRGEAYECRVCGYRLVVDATGRCTEEHVFLCCGRPMQKKAGK